MNIRYPSIKERILQARKKFFPSFDLSMRDCFSSNEKDEESRTLEKERKKLEKRE